MNVSQMMTELSYTEFSNLAVGNNGDGSIKEERIPSVIASINGALLRMYSRYLFSHKMVVIRKQATRTKYVISREFAESNPDAVAPYVVDMDSPFTDDIIKIISVHYRCPRTNEYLGVDQRFRKKRVTVDVPRTVNMPDIVPTDELLYVKYRASHPVVSFEDDTFIQIPPSGYEAVKAYVASKEYSSMNTETGIAKGQEHMAMFEKICGELVDRDTIGITEEFPNNRFEQRGFV